MHTRQGVDEVPALEQSSVSDVCLKCGESRLNRRELYDFASGTKAQCVDAMHAISPWEKPFELTAQGMYPQELDADGRTVHSKHCRAVFSRRDWCCHRCVELMHGKKPKSSTHKVSAMRKLRSLQSSFLMIATPADRC